MPESLIERDRAQLILLQHMLSHYQFSAFKKYIKGSSQWYTPRLDKLLSLAYAYLHTDLETIEELATQLNILHLNNPSFLKRRVYSYTQSLAVKLHHEEYDDYLRALTPLLVDIMRLIIEVNALPNLDHYLIKIYEETPEGKSLYRGLQWKQSNIEAHNNIIRQTWQKYYGNYFSYSHYVSSSHLLKIIVDHVPNPKIVKACQKIRMIEKYARNLTAHELVYVDEEWLEYRTGSSGLEIHNLLMQLTQYAGLTDKRQWQTLTIIEAEIEEELRQLYKNKSSRQKN